ncbi:MAG: hypothetical protein V1909_02830 [Candidatus Micrarchaeota archaeon]
MSDFPIYRSARTAKRIVREYPLGDTGIAKITVLGTGVSGSKSGNIISKSGMLERNGLIFPRRNLVIRADVLEEGIFAAGEKKGWNANFITEGDSSRKAFGEWSSHEIWPIAEGIFDGRPFYIRSDAFGDSLGRGAYESVPFANAYREEKSKESLKVGFSSGLFEVIKSYFSDTAKAFRSATRVNQPGMCVFLSQFIGQPATRNKLLMPFLSAVVKTTLFQEQPGKGIVRFEYGMGKGALSGRSIIVENGNPIETVVNKTREKGIYCSWQGSRITAFSLEHSIDMEYDDSKWTYLCSVLAGAYPLAGKWVDDQGKELLSWLVNILPKLERENGAPLYLELVSSSFQNRLRWFVVQAADYPPMHAMPPPPKAVQFISNTDFYGHGEVNGEKEIFAFSREAFTNGKAKEELTAINASHKDFVVVLPQEALTGTNLTSLSGKCFSNACAVLEYQTLEGELYRGTVHDRASYEHFEQLARDLETLFIPIEKLKLEGFEQEFSFERATALKGDVHIACDKERQIAWGNITNLSRIDNGSIQKSF